MIYKSKRMVDKPEEDDFELIPLDSENPSIFERHTEYYSLGFICTVV
jgi:hypothetical protein